MGNGIKLPEDQRPSFDSIRNRLRSRVSAYLCRLFVEDVQNDCTCSIETYESDPDKKILYVTSTGTSTHPNGRLPLPMLSDINDADIVNLLERACSYAQDSWSDLVPWHMLYNGSATSYEKLLEAASIFHIEATNWAHMPFISKDYVFFLPEPDFFGAISVNIDKFGAFCVAGQVLKVYLGSEVIIRSKGLVELR